MNSSQLTSLMIVVLTLSITTSIQSAENRDHRKDIKDSSELVHQFKEWMIGANNEGVVDAVLTSGVSKPSSYNLKNLERKRFLQYEKQGIGRGINLGWTNNASSKTASKKASWLFSPRTKSHNDKGSVLRKQPIKYGETIAISWVKSGKNSSWNSKNSFIKYSKRKVGIDLDWSKSPAYEWTILGGRPGTTVKRGIDKIVIYNINKKQPLVYFPRKLGGRIGWAEKNGGILGIVVKKREMPDINVWRALMMDHTKKALSR